MIGRDLLQIRDRAGIARAAGANTDEAHWPLSKAGPPPVLMEAAKKSTAGERAAP